MGKSSSSEDYMKVILILHKRKGLVRSVDIAEEMGVTKPSVSNAMKKLREEKMIYFGDDGNIIFTDEGRTFAEKIYSKHSLLSKLLRIIGVNKDTADKEACMMEHAISDETYKCLGEFINAHGGETFMEKKI
ncbi:MAG: metal-dependent transcriptional regulator [Lachnospiraceae bacterium]|nr:metal-dependent transcriptional regulator [Lachnospiraceae bacterium]